MTIASLVKIENKKLAEADADVIHKACKGFGTVDSLLIRTICSRSKQQLFNIDMVYREKYGLSLADQISSECNGNYKNFLVACVTPEDHYAASQFNKACKGAGTNEDTLIEIFNSRDADEVEAFKKKYQGAYGKSVVDVVKDELGGNLEKVFVELVQRPRNQGSGADVALAKTQAENLHKAAKGFGTDEKVFIEILTSSTRSQVQAIKEAYETAHNKSLAALIKSEFTGKLEDALVALLFPSTSAFSAHVLHKAMSGLGTDEGPITRLLGGNNKNEVALIAKEYQKMYNSRLVDDLRKEVSGDYFEAVETWIEAEDPLGYSLGQLKAEDKVAHDLAYAIAERDADWVFLATKGIGTNEEAVIDVLCSRNKRQIFRADMFFRQKYGKSLSDKIDGECSGNFRKLLKYISMPTPQFDVYMLHKAFEGLGTNEALLFDLLVTWSNARVRAAKKHYEAKYNTALIDRVNSELSGHLKTLAIKLVRAERSEAAADKDLAAKQAAELHEAGSGQWGTNEEKFIEILASSSIEQCQAIKEVYEATYNESLGQAIKNEISGDFERVLLGLIRDPVDHQAEALREAFAGFGTDEGAVCRIIGGTDKPELKKIAERYFEKYGTRVVEDLGKEVSGDFLRAAVEWIDNNEFSEGLDALLTEEQ